MTVQKDEESGADGQTGNPAEALYKFLQKILIQNKVDFMVAPYSASAQVCSCSCLKWLILNITKASISRQATRSFR